MQSPFYKQNKITKVDISLKQLMDVDTTNELAYRRVDNIFPNQVLTSYTNPLRRDAFRFKYLTDLIIAGTGVTITNNAGILTIASTGTASPLTTKGDLYTYTTTNARLPVGTNGQILYADSTTATGLKWDTAPTGGGGLLYGLATQSPAGVYTTTITGATTPLTAGDVFVIKFDTVNDGASTLNINGSGAVNIYKNTNTPIASGDIKANQTVEVVYDGTNFQAIGLISDQLLAYVHNDEGAVISKGQVVYAYQASGNKMSVKLARADTDATSAKTIGLVYDSSIGIGGEGYIIIQGVIEGINTAAFSAGNTLYLSGSTFGGVTATKPYAPIHLVYVGIVERANAGNGQIYVRCQNGYELDEIHDVDLVTTPPVNNDVLVFDTSTTPDLWKPKSIPTILGMTTVGNNLATIPNPSAVSYIRIKSDNTVDTRTPAQVLTDLGVAGTIILNRDFANTYTASTVSTNTVLFSVLIPANTLQVNDWITTRTLSKASSAGGNFYIYINTTATIGGTQLAQWNPTANLSGLFERNFAVGAIGSSGNLKYFNSSMSGISLYSGFNANYVTATIDTTINQYLVFSASPGTSGTATTYGNLITILR